MLLGHSAAACQRGSEQSGDAMSSAQGQQGAGTAARPTPASGGTNKDRDAAISPGRRPGQATGLVPFWAGTEGRSVVCADLVLCFTAEHAAQRGRGTRQEGGGLEDHEPPEQPSAKGVLSPKILILAE